MIKKSQKQVDKLFEAMTHDLFYKFLENADVVFEKLYLDEELSRQDTWAARASIETRLLIEFGFMVSDQKRSEIDGRRYKKNTKKKKKVASPATKKVAPKSKRRAVVDKIS